MKEIDLNIIKRNIIFSIFESLYKSNAITKKEFNRIVSSIN